MLVRSANISHPSTAFLPAYGKKSVVGHCWGREDTFETPMASPATAPSLPFVYPGAGEVLSLQQCQHPQEGC